MSQLSRAPENKGEPGANRRCRSSQQARATVFQGESQAKWAPGNGGEPEMKGNSNYGRARGDGHQEAGASQSRWATASVGELMGKREFNMLFLLAAQCYPPKIARQLIRDCREDIKTLGWDHAQRKWARFVEKAQGGEEASKR